MRLLLDPKNEELTDILKTLLTDNIDITAREVDRDNLRLIARPWPEGAL